MTDDEDTEEIQGVTTLELFFDLVFVFTITQLTSVLSDEPTWTGLLQVSLMLGIIFWMYGGYAWLTNSVAVDRLLRRLILLGGMAGFLIVALAVPQAFTGAGATFGLAYGRDEAAREGTGLQALDELGAEADAPPPPGRARGLRRPAARADCARARGAVRARAGPDEPADRRRAS